ncbi:EAL domain-containing protein [Paraburkholderia sp. Se-20369]|nr:EAL domain-containing protein [Paraburkholderia sp. Se-20369]
MDKTGASFNLSEMMGDADRGLSRKEFFLVFQPKMRMQAGVLSGFESLMRWRHPVRGILMPSSFITLAEDSPLVHRFTDFVLTEAASTLAQWAARGYDGLSLAVNLPAREITRSGLVRKMAAVLDAHAVNPARLQIELTETTDPGPLDTLAAAVTSIREMGVSVAVDDFGAGCWSLNILHHLSVDTLKLDRSFMLDIHKNEKSRVIVEALVQLGKCLGKRVVIEGVETEAQFAWAGTMGEVDCQGYYISEPVHGERVSELIGRYGVLN